MHDLTLHDRPPDPHPGSLIARAGDNAVEVAADLVRQEQRCRGLLHLALDLLRVAFLTRAPLGNDRELLDRVGRRLSGTRCLEKALGHDVRIAAIGRRRMRIVANRKAEVSWW